MADGSCSLGLVPSKTSSTRYRVIGAVTPQNTHRARLKRMRRTVLNSSRQLIRSRRGFRDRWLMLTMTYAESVEWTREHIPTFFHRVRMWCARRGIECAYVWVMELTKRGRPHYHVLFRLPHGHYLPKADTCGWWTYGSTRTEQARGAVGYIAKYASKGGDLAGFPKGARIHGAAGLNKESRVIVRFWNLPVWCREQLTEVQRTSRTKGGFVVTDTGEFLPTPYRVFSRGGVLLIVKMEFQS